MEHFSEILDDLSILKQDNVRFDIDLIPHLLVLMIHELRELNKNIKGEQFLK